jgi:Na+-translocating ferredoxin:NAD+ oxidoreductase RNF subunit RnfB
MDFKIIVNSVVSLGGLGLIFGAGLAFASKKFAVEIDPRVDLVNDALPAANCGGCGYPGCMAFANAVVNGEAPVNGCPVGGKECADAVAEIMGVDASAGVPQVAKVLCTGELGVCKEEFKYHGVDSCLAANMISGGSKACQFGCIGFGSCADICPFDAIEIKDNHLAHIDPDKCVACGKCLDICPKHIIKMVPKEQFVVVVCNNLEKGGFVKKNCNEACIACGICQRVCPFDAIHVEDNLARIDYSKCTNCMICAEKCPTKAIEAQFEKRKTAFIIADDCIGCTICKKVCPVDAIEGEVKKVHEVDPEKCVGCSKCAEKCPRDAIEMR